MTLFKLISNFFIKDPLLEEYVTAKHAWKLNPADMCELARNSVLMSGYTNEEINSWIDDYNENDISKTNVPQLRLKYRQDNLKNETKYINLAYLHMDTK